MVQHCVVATCFPRPSRGNLARRHSRSTSVYLAASPRNNAFQLCSRVFALFQMASSHGFQRFAMLAPFRGKHAKRGMVWQSPRPHVSWHSTTNGTGSRPHACPAKPVQAWHRTPFTMLFATRPPGETFPQHVPVSGGCSRKVLLPVAARPDHKVVGPPAFFRVLWKIVNAVGAQGRGEPYVCRSASIGSMRAALRAG